MPEEGAVRVRRMMIFKAIDACSLAMFAGGVAALLTVDSMKVRGMRHCAGSAGWSRSANEGRMPPFKTIGALTYQVDVLPLHTLPEGASERNGSVEEGPRSGGFAHVSYFDL